jgi:hypothetical protein
MGAIPKHRAALLNRSALNGLQIRESNSNVVQNSRAVSDMKKVTLHDCSARVRRERYSVSQSRRGQEVDAMDLK